MEDIAELEKSISEQLNYYNSLTKNQENQDKRTIYKVPNHIRDSQKSAYDPMVLSIGPYHHGGPGLSTMQKAKWNCLRHILRLNKERDLIDYLNAIGSVEKEARSFYDSEINTENHEFLQTLLLDGCFILVSLYGTREFSESKIKSGGKKKIKNLKNKSSVADEFTVKYVVTNSVLELKRSLIDRSKYPINFNSNGFYNCVFHDLLLLENQIPFFVVKKIYAVLRGEEEKPDLSFIIGIIEYMEKDMLVEFPIGISKSGKTNDDFYHLLHLCHMYFKPSKKEKPAEKPPNRNIFRLLKLFLKENKEKKPLMDQQPMRFRRAVEYYESGIEIRVKESGISNPHSLLDITFKNGVLEIPHLPLDETIAHLFRNLIALEQTSPKFGNDFCAYIILMSQLVSTSEDSTLLCQRNIIEHMLETDADVANLLTDLGEDLVFDFRNEYYLKEMLCEMEGYYQKRRHKWMAWLWHKNFSNPWMGIIKIAGIITVFSTLVTTVFTVLVFGKPTEVRIIGMN